MRRFDFPRGSFNLYDREGILLTEIAVAAWYAPAAVQKVSSAPWSVAWPRDRA